MIESLPHINASLNLLATVLLVIGYVLIKRRRGLDPSIPEEATQIAACEKQHKIAMLSAFGVSTVFLGCYLVYHYNVGSKNFPKADYAAVFYWLYLMVLLPHIILAATVPFLGITTIILGLTERRKGHMKFARITFPIWLYVSITGVLVYLFIYWWFPPVSGS